MRTFLFIFTMLFLVSILLWPFLVIAGAMSFDAPGAQDNLLTNLIMAWAVFYPLPIIVGAIGVWKTRADPTLKRIVLFAGVCSLSLLIPIVLFSLLGIFCGGQFACDG